MLFGKTFEKETLFMVCSGILSVLSVLISVGILGFAVFASQYGFDFTDESYYVLLIEQSQVYKYTLSQFGFIYQPIANLLKYNILYLRIFNILITYLLSALTLAIYYFFSFKDNKSLVSHRINKLIAIAGISTSSLLYFTSLKMLTTPSYNSLNFQGILLAISGLIIAQDSHRILSAIGSIVMSIGGWLVFMAKPTTAMLLGIICFFVLLLNKKNNLLQVIALVLTLGALIMFTIYSLDTSLCVFINRYKTDFEGIKLLGAGYNSTSLCRIDFPQLSTIESGLLLLNSILIALLLYFLYKNWCFIIASFCCIGGFSIYAYANYEQLTASAFTLPRFSQLQLLALPSGVLLFITSCYMLDWKSGKKSEYTLMPLILLLIPHIYAFGTNNNYFYSSSAVAFFWILAAIGLLVAFDRYLAQISLLPFAFISQVATIIFLLHAVGNPYRQPNNLFRETNLVSINNSWSKLRVNIHVGQYFDEIRKLAIRGQFKSDDAIIDLTGCSPGIAVILETYNLGAPWFYGGYPGSNPMALFYLMKLPGNQIRKAWVITEPFGKRALNEEILSKWGLSLVNDYEIVGKVIAPAGYRGSRNDSLQVIYKPK